ncbi:MAG: hypothetical protein JWN04_5943 [Myxococcaceae bacterium]|nr:hypothetical protein [Myxococcaceae bacterium]
MWLHLLTAFGCHGRGCLGDELQGEVDGQRFLRCAQVAAPSGRSVRLGPLQLTIDGRVLSIEGASELRVTAFTGPVGAAFERSDLEQLTRSRPGLVFYLGGLGDDLATARQNLASLAALRVPTLFVAGGADRLPVIEAAFAALGEGERDTLLNASGLREVRIGSDRFIPVAGAPFGRYARDEQSCGLDNDDFEQIQASARERSAMRTWLVSWQAPAGASLSDGFGGAELGSPDLKALATAVEASGGLYAYPEGQVLQAQSASSWIVPRLSRVGAQQADGSRLRGQVLSLVLTTKGLVFTP